MSPRHLELPAAIAAVALAAAAPGAVVYSHYNNTVDHAYKVVHMPDFDQRRAASDSVPGLPNNGSMYCVPTSTMNVTAYIASHGFPTVPPQDYPWEDPSSYDVATGSDFILGLLMNTSPTMGTGGDGWYNGTTAWVPLDKFTVSAFYASDTWWPRRWDIAQSAANGSLVSLCWGWYNTVGQAGGIPIIQRAGGHCVTLTEIHGGSTNATMFVRDPADDAVNLTTQSPFMSRMFWTETRHAYVGGTLRSLDNFTTTQGVLSTRFLDGYVGVRPKAGYSLTQDNAFQFEYVAQLFGALHDTSFEIQAAAAVDDFAIGLHQNAIYALVNIGGGEVRLVCYPIHPGDPVELDFTFPRPAQMTMGTRNRLYIAAGELFHVFDVERGEISLQLAMPGIVGAMAYDDENEEVLVLDTEHRMIRRIAWHGDGEGEAILLPAVIPMTGPMSMQWDPTRRGAWLLASDFAKLYFIPFDDPDGAHEVVLADAEQPTSVDVDDRGHLFTADGGFVREYRPVELGEYVREFGSLFAGMTTGPDFRVTKSRTNFDPNQHVQGWHNVLPVLNYGIPELDCDGDVNGDGAVGFGDLLAVLAEWGPCPGGDDCLADLDRDGTVGFADLLILLATWGACP